MLVADFNNAGHITPLVYEQRVPRLGQGVDAERNLNPASVQRVIAVLREYSQILRRHPVDTLIVAGTSAVRDAQNRTEFVEQVRRETGFDLEILSGEDEALWTYRGAISGIPHLARATVIDIGGGSTEVSVGNDVSIERKTSLNIGSVRLTERCFKHDPPTHHELEKAVGIVADELANVSGFPFPHSTLVGVAGTATALAILDQGLPVFNLDAVISYRLKLERVAVLFQLLRTTPSAAILKLSSVMEGRHDIITAGVLILHEIMVHCKFDEMIVSERGVRYGLAIREWEKHRH
jgi:exopolyphosphatase/guanosine-5'-triphosphate,3'-diphosphate pyrophosphatase